LDVRAFRLSPKIKVRLPDDQLLALYSGSEYRYRYAIFGHTFFLKNDNKHTMYVFLLLRIYMSFCVQDHGNLANGCSLSAQNEIFHVCPKRRKTAMMFLCPPLV
jgi:hypothetical protein